MAPPLRVAIVLALLILGGCVMNFGPDFDGHFAGHRRAEAHNREHIGKLPLGTPAQDVIAELGKPDFADAWMAGGQETRVLRYRTHRTQADGDTSRDETTALVFRGGRLAGIGEQALATAD